MDFAREHLKQLGWQEGGGLGKEHHGIVEALKPRLKFDTAGIGHDPAKEFTHTWWSEAYNNAANSITVTDATDGCQLVAKPKKKKKKSKTHQSTYSNFVTGGMLIGDQVTEDGAAGGEAVEETVEAAVALRLNDDELLAACGGRTAHKGARHGHKMDGKLARIMAQEAVIVDSLTDGRGGEEQTATKKKKKRKHADVEGSQSAGVECEPGNIERDQSRAKHKKKKRKQMNPDAVDVSVNASNGDDSSVEKKKKRKKKRKAEQES